METVNVLITPGFRFGEADLAAVQTVDPRVRLLQCGDESRRFLWSPGDGSDPAEQQLNALLAEAEVIFAAYDRISDLQRRAPKLRWLQTLQAGIEQYLRNGVLWPGLLFTNGSGSSALPIAEWVLMAVLALAKGVPQYSRLQHEHRWERKHGFELHGKTVGIVGLGAIGGETARLVRALGCRVIGIRRSASEPQEDTQGVDLLLPPRELPRLLAESDFVVLAAPSTSETAALIDAVALAQMKPGAFLINVARGALVDEQALVEALKQGRIGGAALDVFAHEPLPPESELWDLPGVLITPHSSSISEFTSRRGIELFQDNLRRYLAGEPLLNLVDPARGY